MPIASMACRVRERDELKKTQEDTVKKGQDLRETLEFEKKTAEDHLAMTKHAEVTEEGSIVLGG